VIEQISLDGRVVYKANESLKQIPGVDPAAAFQLRTILQGVVARGTAARLSALSNMIGGKTGTSDEFNDSWFIGFSRDVTIAIWVGYDNTTMKSRKTLGHGNAGSRVALPIFDSIMKAVWADYAPQMALPGPSPEANRRLVALPIDVRSGQRIDTRDRTAFVEFFRLDDSGRLDETQYRLVSRGHDYSVGDNDHQPTYQQNNPFFFAPWFSRNFEGTPQPTYRQREYEGGGRRPVPRGQRGFDEDERRPQQPFGFFGGRGGF
jgi:penicillin-binding protein 1A